MHAGLPPPLPSRTPLRCRFMSFFSQGDEEIVMCAKNGPQGLTVPFPLRTMLPRCASTHFQSTEKNDEKQRHTFGHPPHKHFQQAPRPDPQRGVRDLGLWCARYLVHE